MRPVEPPNGVVVFAGELSVAFFQTPIGIINQFGCSDADDGKGAECRCKVIGQRELKSAENIAALDGELLGKLKRAQRHYCEDGEQHHHANTPRLH